MLQRFQTATMLPYASAAARRHFFFEDLFPSSEESVVGLLAAGSLPQGGWDGADWAGPAGAQLATAFAYNPTATRVCAQREGLMRATANGWRLPGLRASARRSSSWGCSEAGQARPIAARPLIAWPHSACPAYDEFYTCGAWMHADGTQSVWLLPNQ